MITSFALVLSLIIATGFGIQAVPMAMFITLTSSALLAGV